MSWVRTLDKVGAKDGNVVATVTFTSDSGEVITRVIPGNDLTPERLAAFCDGFVAVLEVRDASLAAFTDLVGKPIPPGKTPSTDEQEAKSFFEQLAKLNALTVSVEKGLTKADDQDLADLTASVKAAFKPEYTTDVRFR